MGRNEEHVCGFRIICIIWRCVLLALDLAHLASRSPTKFMKEILAPVLLFAASQTYWGNSMAEGNGTVVVQTGAWRSFLFIHFRWETGLTWDFCYYYSLGISERGWLDLAG